MYGQKTSVGIVFWPVVFWPYFFNLRGGNGYRAVLFQRDIYRASMILFCPVTFCGFSALKICKGIYRVSMDPFIKILVNNFLY